MFKIDPSESRNRSIVDLSHAPRDADGLVSYGGDFCILRPAEPGRGNGRLLFEFVNRGNKRALHFFNDAPSGNMPLSLADAGNGFLMREGYAVAWLGWQGDLWPGDDRCTLSVPVAREGTTAIEGKIFAEFTPTSDGVKVYPLSAATTCRSYPVVPHAHSSASLTRRRYYWSSREEVPRDRWDFARTEGGQGADNQGAERAVMPSDFHIHMPDGFEPGWIYELVYLGQDPLVLGLGHSAVRDFVAALRHGDAAGSDEVAREVAALEIERAYCWGRSQSGRCIRDFIYHGFNEDLAGRKVFDGAMPHVSGAGKMWLNQRFAKPTLLPGQSYENHTAPADIFPFSYAASSDHLTGARDAILKRPNSDPFVIHTDSASEYWHRRASLVHTDTEGNDLAQPETVRIYLWASSQHWAYPRDVELTSGISEQLFNTVATSMFFRALLRRLDDWVTRGIAPPESRIPLVAEGTLATFEDWRASFPQIPAVTCPASESRLEAMDYGTNYAAGILDQVPPAIYASRSYAVRVPGVDADGNDIAGLRAPMVQAPLGTYTGWSVRRRELGAGAMVGVTGSYIPFPETREVAEATRDPRTSILDRYPTADAYRDAIAAAVDGLIRDGFVIEEDRSRCIALAKDWGCSRHRVVLGS
ncbi:alpha/beta hydrolase domain-containing protein [Bosea vestrisii]|uniref:alpha/beta hydrolase domain-containing protein n=1 Tax=Bosea vestrisii TaxID=151416 RepID=UPI0024DFF32C|nr:alpha/beta hydrolase domain-containing protein [Bosea vestrisii]WID95226.1 alpha/beta hydrolase domain-containing protein [Bosea vestrisii]